jgi:hypothetical protein
LLAERRTGGPAPWSRVVYDITRGTNRAGAGMGIHRDGIAFVLGAGASRGVSYANLGDIPSPLDGDFFDLLQRLAPHAKDRESVDRVLSWVLPLPGEFRCSMERTFYTLHQQAYLRRHLITDDKGVGEEEVVGNFARVVQAILRAAHGQKICTFHEKLFGSLGNEDSIVSFNYDLVVERALMKRADRERVPFERGRYALSGPSTKENDFPTILKLHGSSNWVWNESRTDFELRDKKWKDFEKSPRYMRHSTHRTDFPIFLPFWDKRIEQGPWLGLWRSAYQRLRKAKVLFVWGYSLPVTDIKVRELLNISIQDSGRGMKLCIVDPSPQTRQRWRDLLTHALFWEYRSIQEFFDNRPPWFILRFGSNGAA